MIVSLLNSGPHTVTVTPVIKQKASNGAPRYVRGTPVTVSHVMVQPMTASEVDGQVTAITTMYQVIGSGVWPGGPHSIVEWNGREWDQEGEARIYSVSPRTAHFDVMIRARDAQVY